MQRTMWKHTSWQRHQPDKLDAMALTGLELSYRIPNVL